MKIIITENQFKSLISNLDVEEILKESENKKKLKLIKTS